jgi:DNA-directed RNA polymerase specialized sigma24 family protein
VRALRRADDDATDAVQEVAHAMKLSEGTVKSQLHAARERLREMLTESSRG